MEHVFHVVKRIFGFTKVRYRGIEKNAHRLLVNFALANLYLHRRRLLTSGAQCLSKCTIWQRNRKSQEYD